MHRILPCNLYQLYRFQKGVRQKPWSLIVGNAMLKMHRCPLGARRGWCRPHTSWQQTFISDLKLACLSWDEVEALAEARQWWRDLIA